MHRRTPTRIADIRHQQRAVVLLDVKYQRGIQLQKLLLSLTSPGKKVIEETLHWVGLSWVAVTNNFN